MVKKEILYPLVQQGSRYMKQGGLAEYTINTPPEEAETTTEIYGNTILWVKNRVFGATLRLTDSARGRSAVVFYFEHTETGEVYPMRLNELTEMLKKVTMVNGVVEGNWTFKKQGANFGIAHVEGDLDVQR